MRKLGTNIPPLVNSYMNSSPSMKMLGTAINDEFSDVEETGIMICYTEMYPEKRDRHTMASVSEWLAKVRKRFPKLSSETIDKLKEHRHKRKFAIFERFKRKRDKE